MNKSEVKKLVEYFEGLKYEVDILKSTDNRYDSNNTQKILEFIKESVDSENIIETKILHNHFVEQNGYMSKKTLHNQINKLIKMNEIEKVKNGIYKLFERDNLDEEEE